MNMGRILFSAFCALMLALPGGAPAVAAAAGSQSANSLKDSVELTLRHNPNLRVAQEARQAAEFDRKRARSGFLPSLNLSGGAGTELYSDSLTRDWRNNGGQKDSSFYSRSTYSATLSQPLWDGLAAWSRLDAARAMLSSAEQRLYDNAEALALDAIMSHIELERQRKLVELSQINVNNHRRILRTQVERQQAGASARSDVTQTQARLARAESSLADASLAYEAAQLNYFNLTGALPGNLAPASAPTSLPEEAQELQRRAMTCNPKVQAALAEVEAARARRDTGKSAFHPRIFAEAGAGYDRQPASSQTYIKEASLMLRGQWNLFNGGYDYYNVKADNARARQAGLQLAALRDNLRKEAHLAWKQWKTSAAQSKTYASAVRFNTDTSGMYLQQFNTGQRSLLDLLDAENELYSSSLLLVSSRMNEIATQYRILALSGGLLEYLGIDRESLAVETDGNTGAE